MKLGHARGKDRFEGRIAGARGLGGALRARGFWRAVARRGGFVKNAKTGLYVPGEILWEDQWENLVVNQGLNHMLGVEFNAATQITTWYLALLKTTPNPVAGSTYQNFMGTANQEVTAYDEANRPTWTEAAPSSQSITNAASPARFTISTNGTVVGGAALVSNNTKNDSGAGPFMYAAGAFSAGDKSLDDNDTLDVTATFTLADDGV